MSGEPIKLVEGRGCDGCTMCCKLLAIKEIEKPPLQWCNKCAPGVGCTIYEKRPKECAGFYCDFLRRPDMGEHWHPKHSRMVVVYRAAVRSMAIYADPSRKGAWRKAPYYPQIKSWANALYPEHGQVIVWEGKNAVAVMPNRDKDLGPGEPSQLVAVFEKMTSQGMIYDAVLTNKDEPIENAAKRLGK